MALIFQAAVKCWVGKSLGITTDNEFMSKYAAVIGQPQ